MANIINQVDYSIGSGIKQSGMGLAHNKSHLKPDKYTYRQKIKIAKDLRPITHQEALDDYEQLENVNLKSVTPASRIGNKVVDYFTYPERLATRGKTGLSYFDLITNHSFFEKKASIKRIIDYIKANNPRANFFQIWRQISSLYFSAINIFKPLNAMKIYARYKPTSVLDFTMGWGGRLIGACALNVPHYIGIDLNDKLEQPYADMVDFVKPLTTTKITLFFKDALKVDYSKLRYDMVFTSPPYYNIEIYRGNEVLSKDDWDKQFYEPIFEMTFKNMQRGGHYCLNVPKEVYERVCLKLFGRADQLVPFNKIKRARGGGEKYEEFIYVWVKH